MKAKDGAANIAIRAYLKMRLNLYRCYKVACEWFLKPFLNLKYAGRSVVLELCKPLASTLFASASLTTKQKENSKGTKHTKTQPALNQ